MKVQINLEMSNGLMYWTASMVGFPSLYLKLVVVVDMVVVVVVVLVVVVDMVE